MSQLVSEARKTARGSLMLIAGNALGTFIAGLGSIVLARVLGSGAYGAYTLSLTVANFLLFFTDPGISAAITRFSARLTVEKRLGAAVHVIRLGLITRASLGALATVMGILFAPMLSLLLLNRPELETVVKIVAVSILPLAAYGAIGSALIGLSDVKNYSALYVVQQILRTVLRPLLVITGLGLLGAVIGHVAAVYVVCIAGLAVLYRVHLKDIEKVNSPNLKDMLVFWKNPVPQPGFLMRRSVIDQIGFLDESYSFAFDFEYWIRMAVHDMKGMHIPQKLAAFRMHRDAKTYTKQDVRIKDRFGLYEQYFQDERISQEFKKKYLRKSKNKLYLNADDIFYKRDDPEKLKKFALQGIQESKWNVPAYLYLCISLFGKTSYSVVY